MQTSRDHDLLSVYSLTLALLSVPLSANMHASPGQSIIGDGDDKLNKSAPNLSHHFMPSPSLHRHRGDFLEPNM